jgi:hypothetical protein
MHFDITPQLYQQMHFISYVYSLTLHVFRLQQSHHQGFKVTFTLTFTNPFGITTYTPHCMSRIPDDGSIAAETYAGLLDMLKK